jgi:hypothetical protein
MAFPPGVLPINRTDATPQQATHPADHNAISAAINDTVSTVVGMQAVQVRTGTVGNQTGQTVAPGAVVTLGWSSVSDPAWGTSGVFTVPAGKAGVYAATLRVTGPTMPANTFADVVLTVAGNVYAAFIPPAKTQVSICAVVAMDDGAQCFVQVYNPLGTSQFFSGNLSLTRVAQ